MYDIQKNAFSRTPSTLAVVKLDRCQENHGSAPCVATGKPCFNTYETCQDIDNYNPIPHDYIFCLNKTPSPIPGEIIFPYIDSVTDLPQEIRMDESLLINQRVTINMFDEPDNDYGIDPYRVSPVLRQSAGGTDNISPAGTFWRRLRARNPHYKNRRVEILDGFVANGFTLANYKVRFEGVLDNIKISGKGKVSLITKGKLQLTDVEYPAKTDGRLNTGLSTGTGSFQLAAWSGIDRYAATASSVYDAAGILVIDNEVIGYTTRTFDSNMGMTTFGGVTRGMYNNYGYSAASIHDADAQVQQAVHLSGNPIDLIKLLLNKAGLTDADIDIGMLNEERDTWFQGVTFETVLYKSGKIKKYLKELREQTGTYIWQGENQLIKVKSVTPKGAGQIYKQITDDANIVYESTSLDDNESGRYTRAVVWYDIYAGKEGSEDEHFRRAAAVIDAEAESVNAYNEQKDYKPIYSRWIKSLLVNDNYPRTLVSRIVQRFRNGVKRIPFEIELKDDDLALGELFELLTANITDYDGNPKTIKCVVVKKQFQGNVIKITAYDTKITGRPAFIAPNTVADTYAAASKADRGYCYIASGNPLSPGEGDDPYLIT